ncbi:cytochrome c biogenesis protein CcdA [Natroniella sulfidigena]|uniref:cytochrome c biogenesis CcdA family protein n=1 Tax=Natroniella sulfidigena TaxID=723921 RepID=UPI00200B137E|nr:cytochrome c biogenesis protein CcdA [Natroniella sulfidigena]MCK8816277.1 cytochrome c biogenesis protein CcdA [Natroniella sulfidigena]
MEGIYLIALMIGFLSFLAPCIIPMMTAYFSMISGFSVENMEAASFERRELLVNTSIFVLAFTLVFVSIGGLIDSLGHLLMDQMRLFNLVAGIFIIFIGAKLLGVLPSSKLHNLSSRVSIVSVSKRYEYLTVFITGIFFALIASHLVGPTLSSIFVITGTTEVNNLLIMFFFSIGLAIPYFLMAISFEKAVGLMAGAKRYTRFFQVIFGGVLLIVGLLLVTNRIVIMERLFRDLIKFIFNAG